MAYERATWELVVEAARMSIAQSGHHVTIAYDPLPSVRFRTEEVCHAG